MKLTIYQKLLVFIIPIVCFSIFGVGYYSYFIAREEIIREIKTKMENKAEDMAMEISRLCRDAGVNLITLSELTSIADYHNNIEYELYHEAEVCRRSIERFMLDFSRRSKSYSGISLFNEKRIEISRIIKEQVGPRRKNIKNKLFFEETRRLKRGEIYISPVEMGDDNQGLILRHATPIFNEAGEFKGVVALDLAFMKIPNIMGGVKIGKTGYAYLINQEGLLLAHSGTKQIFAPIGIPELDKVIERMIAGNKGWEVYSTPEGDYLIGYAPVEAMRFSVGVTAPYSDFTGKINQIKINSALAMLFITSIATFGILIIARDISAPIKKLVHHTREVSNGNFDHQTHVSSMDEIGELGGSFNEMVAKLKSSQEEIERWNKELEERVGKTSGELKAEKEKLEGVFLCMVDAVIVIDKVSRVIDLNPAAEKLLGTSKSVLIGHQILVNHKALQAEILAIRNLQAICAPKEPDQEFLKCWDYFHCKNNECPGYQSEEWRCWLLSGTLCDHSPQGLSESKSELKNCSQCPLFIQIREKYTPVKLTDSREIKLDIPQRFIRVFRTPMFDGGNRFIGNVFVVHDITEDKELDQIKSEFISTVSHELRTPLSSIRSFSELLLDDIGMVDIETQKRFLSIITEESERLTRLISDLLDLQKMHIEKMIFDMERIQISQIIEKCTQSFSGLAKKKDINVCYEYSGKLPLVHGDKDKLYQVLSNLLSNAIKFSEEKGQIKVEAEEVPDGVLVSVSDKGIGIPEDKREKVFEKFYQILDSPVKTRMGTGLGLAIARQIVEHHGGRIWVESKVREGSKFSFIIPKALVDSVSVSV